MSHRKWNAKRNAPDPLGPDRQIEFFRRKKRGARTERSIEPNLPNIDWKFYLPDVCPDCDGKGFLKRQRECPTCHGNCFIPNKRTLPEEVNQLEITEPEKWSKTRYRVKAYDKVANGHMASASFDRESDAIDFANFLQGWHVNLVRIEVYKERML